MQKQRKIVNHSGNNLKQGGYELARPDTRHSFLVAAKLFRTPRPEIIRQLSAMQQQFTQP